MRISLVLLAGLLSFAAFAAPRVQARSEAAAPPRRGTSVVIEPTSGTTFYRPPGQAQEAAHRRDERAGQHDHRRDERPHGHQSVNGAADFFGGAFVIREPKKQAVTQLWLAGKDPRSCKAKTPRVVRQLWGDGKGRFQTRGRYAAATVRGTKWRVADRCDGTLVTVARGVVAVRDFGLGRTVLVRPGQSYLARRTR